MMLVPVTMAQSMAAPIVMPGLAPGIHVFLPLDLVRAWMAGTSPAMTG
jgi:hypothetical protein